MNHTEIAQLGLIKQAADEDMGSKLMALLSDNAPLGGAVAGGLGGTVYGGLGGAGLGSIIGGGMGAYKGEDGEKLKDALMGALKGGAIGGVGGAVAGGGVGAGLGYGAGKVAQEGIAEQDAQSAALKNLVMSELEKSVPPEEAQNDWAKKMGM